MIALTDLIQAQTADQIQQTFIDGLVSLGVTSAPNWKKGGVARSVLRVFAILASLFSTFLATLAQSGFRDLATGNWLTLWARSVYNVERPGATFAAGILTLINGGGGVYNFGVGQVTALNSTTGATYTNTSVISLGSLATIDVAFQAVAQGSASSSAPGAIDTLQTTMVGVTVTNAEAFVGTDALDDPSLGNLCIAKLGSLSPNGPTDAYRYIALADPTTIPVLVNFGLTTQTSVPITRAQPYADGNGGVALYLATAGGVPSGGDVAIVNARIQAAATPLGTKATVSAANPVTVNVSYETWLKNSSLTTATAESSFATKLITYFAGLPIGGVVLPPVTSGVVSTNAIEGQLFTAVLGTQKAVVSGGDTTLGQADVAVLGTITPTVHIL